MVVMYLVTLGQDCSTVSPSHVPNYWASSALTFYLLALLPPQVTGRLNGWFPSAGSVSFPLPSVPRQCYPQLGTK